MLTNLVYDTAKNKNVSGSLRKRFPRLQWMSEQKAKEADHR